MTAMWKQCRWSAYGICTGTKIINHPPNVQALIRPMKSTHSPLSQSAFTLIELLVAIAIIAILASGNALAHALESQGQGAVHRLCQ